MATDAVYDFMKEHNRPFSVNDIQNSLKDYGKAVVQKALDKLSDQGKVFEKTYGKQKVYCVSQDDGDHKENIDEELKSLDRKINEASIKLKEDEEKLHKVQTELKGYGNKVSLAEAKRIALDLEEEIEGIKAKIEDLKENTVVIPEQDKKKITAAYTKCCSEYKKRKRICKDMIDAISEGYPKGKKHLLQETGIETDEDVGYKFEELKC